LKSDTRGFHRRPGIAVNGQEVHSPGDFRQTLASVPPDSQVNLAIQRTQEVQLQGDASSPRPVTAARPVLPPTNPPVYRGPAPRRLFRRF
jgi:hypothetical protein